MTGSIAHIEIRTDSFPSDKKLGALWRAAWKSDTQPPRFQRTLRTCLLHLTAHEGARLVGFVKMATDGGTHGFLLDPVVHPDLRRSGLGTLLVKTAITTARDRGMQHLHVDFEPSLRTFYEKCGFAPTEAGLIRF